MTTALLAERIEILENTINREARTVDVVLIRPGWSANGRYYSRDVIAKAAPLFEGVKAYANHPTRAQLKAGEGRSVLDITGDYTKVRVREDGALVAERAVYGAAGDAVWPLIERQVDVKPAKPIIGISINALGKASKGKADGKDGVIVESIDIANSADDVDNPAAGGGFERLIAGSDIPSLIADLLSEVTYEEFIKARPDIAESMRKQMKRARQDDAVRALTEERDAAQVALTEAQQQVTELTAQLASVRADLARQTQSVKLERVLRAADFTSEYEALLREQLEQAHPDRWVEILRFEQAKRKADKTPRVQVHGVPLREARVVEGTALVQNTPLRYSDFDSPQAFKAALDARQAKGSH